MPRQRARKLFEPPTSITLSRTEDPTTRKGMLELELGKETISAKLTKKEKEQALCQPG